MLIKQLRKLKKKILLFIAFCIALFGLLLILPPPSGVGGDNWLVINFVKNKWVVLPCAIAAVVFYLKLTPGEIGKNLERDRIFAAAKYLKKYNVLSGGFFIMGFPEDTHETLQNSYDMINELQLDKVLVATLIPFPGTKLFNQVVKNKLFFKMPDLNDLWKHPVSVYQSDFVIKPYNMSLDDLYKWRQKFDILQIKHRKTNLNNLAMTHNVKLDNTGVYPRQIHGGSKKKFSARLVHQK